MKILEIKTIDYGSTDYVSRMLADTFKKNEVKVSIVDNVKRILKNPFKWYSFYNSCKNNEILHSHLGKASLFTSFFKNNNNIQVSTLHGFQKLKHYKNSDFFTSVSSAVKKHYINQGVNPDKIKVIPNGIKNDLLNIDIERNNKVVTIAQIGHLTKNIDFSFSVIRKLKRSGYKFKFLFVGDQGDISFLKEKVIEYKIEKFVDFLGFIDNIENIYKNIDILFSSSELEGFCLPILESMASGLPVISFDNKGIDDYFIHNVNGYIYKNEHDSLVYLKELIDNKDLRIKMGKVNRVKAESYTWDKIGLLYLDYFQMLLNDKNKSLKNRKTL